MTLPAIDISELLDIRLFTVEQLNNLTRSIVSMATMEVEKKIRESISKKLKSTKETYERGLKSYITPKTPFIGTIELVDQLPNMIESGASVFDMKEGFGKSQKKTTTDNGWYLTIPFRWGVSTSIGTEFSNVMIESINKVAEGLKPSIVAKEYGKVEYGDHITIEQLKKLNNYQAHKGQSAGWGGHQPYEHKSPIAQGMLKIQKTYEKDPQNTYVTFRRVSNKSHPDSWIHPGFKPSNFMDDALKEVDIEKLMQPMIETALYLNDNNMSYN